MTNTRLLVWYFYRPVLIISLILTAVGLIQIYKIGIWFIGYSLMTKAVGITVIIAYKNYFSNKSYMYYRNAGYSITRMYSYVFALDMAVFILLALLLSPFIPQHAHIKG